MNQVNNPAARVAALEALIHDLRSDLSYHVHRHKELEEKNRLLTRGAISISYGPLISLAGEILYRLNITGTTKEKLEEICHAQLRLYLGDTARIGILAKEINRYFGGIIDLMLTDFRFFGAMEINLYAMMVIDIENELIKDVLALGTKQKAADAKKDLIRTIMSLKSHRRVKYLELLEKKDCKDGKKLLSLHDLSNFSYGKPEKNED